MGISFTGALASFVFIAIVGSITVWDSHRLETAAILALVMLILKIVVENGPYKLFGKHKAEGKNE
ncbi:hypothetical protein ACRZ5S_22625 (plasmid) [Vibrio scophthalmi]|uniref:hypothetical protein n=1 Tax=Vibrio scophthalmi TaxID=45658 RepID=UPI003EB7D153